MKKAAQKAGENGAANDVYIVYVGRKDIKVYLHQMRDVLFI